ncbi:hypothetical protein PQO03_19125 [Lentisphaera profundi]|uniref:Peptidase MA-like domain-containing protein n=1 Tax=Lentisphaera profundi TaxID=1658616 RepID=A0ABY7VW45_9BACT|nr:hypothetical protein [Lentisphaera profundi]WDE97942.1 hypothetical protein PQO03_19125 [Lentisphaera profundi]
MLQNDLLEKAKAGDFEAVLALDKLGFFPSSTESLEDFSQRLEHLRSAYADLQNDLEVQGFIEIEGIKFKKEDLIPKKMFCDARKGNLELYGFDLDWVPGFFYSPGALFGGCAWGMPPHYLTLFILRPSFRERDKWYIYGRQELMAHEMCHAVRFPLEADKYEEMFAYQTSTSAFRKLFGPMVRSPKETYILIALISLLMGVQVWIYNQEYVERAYFLPLPVFILMSLMVGYFAFLMMRQHLQNKSYERLLQMFSEITDAPRSLAFRLNDKEIDCLLLEKTLTKTLFVDLLDQAGAGDLRKKILFSYLRD